VEEDQAVERAVEGAVVDAGDLDGGAGGVGRELARGGAALEEGVGVGVEEVAAARGHEEGRALVAVVVDAVVDRPPGGEQARPGAEAAVHRVGVGALVGLELVEEAEHRVAGLVDRVLDREQAAVLGVEGEDEAEQDGEQAGVDLAGAVAAVALADPLVEEGRAVALGGGLEAAEQGLEGVKDLVGEALGDLGLLAAALGEQGGQAVGLGLGEPAVAAEQREEGVEHRPAVDLGELAEVEGERAGGLAVGGVEQADVGAVGEQADRDPGVAEEALEFGGGRVAPGGGLVGAIEVAADRGGAVAGVRVGEVPDEGEVAAADAGGLRELGVGVGGLGEVGQGGGGGRFVGVCGFVVCGFGVC
jgi:hypothetical protein